MHSGTDCASLIAQAKRQAQSGNIAAAFVLLAQAQESGASATDSSATNSYATDNTEAWQLATTLAAHVRDWPELRRIASRWINQQATSTAAWQALSRSYFEDSQFDEAIAAYSRVLDLEPDNVSHRVAAARLATAALRHDSARALLMSAESMAPDSGEVLYALSRLYHLTGELAEAERYCRRALAVMPAYAPAYTALGLLTEGRLQSHEINTIRQLAGQTGIHPEHRAMLWFTLGDALDRQGNYAQAFAAWEQANLINQKISAQEGFVYNAVQHEADVNLLAQLFDGHNTPPENNSAIRPIFVVGMPRSGTTLVESILASHSTVHGAGELPALLDMQEQLLTIARRDGVAAARATLLVQADNWRAYYLAKLPVVAGKTFVVDKQPLNFRSIGLIRFLFPESPVIYTQRDAMDVGLSIYRHNFSKNWPCAHRLSDIGHYYTVHSRIIALWQRLFPTGIHVLDHAALVANPDYEIRQLLLFAKLGFEPACLTPHKTKRSVATFSSVQVQHPVSSTYSGRAANYRHHLEPLHASLQNIPQSITR